MALKNQDFKAEPQVHTSEMTTYHNTDLRISLNSASPMPSTIITSPKMRLDRESSSLKMLIMLSSMSVGLDLTRQICSYAMKYHNHGHFPAPSTLLVFLAESIKFLVFFIKALSNNSLCSCTISFAYLVPSVLYALNNNIYFLALRFTTPPIWNILMQSRIICIALVYKFYFKKAITAVQWFGLFILTLAIIILQFSGSDASLSAGKINANLLIALGLAVVGSLFAAIGPVYTEFLLKHDSRSFDDKQLQMYLFGTIVNGGFFSVQQFTQTHSETSLFSISGDYTLLVSLILTWLVSSVVSGIVIAVIIKKLDNIVKLYSQAISAALTAFASFFLFPEDFQFDMLFLVSFVMTIVAIYLYEVKSINCNNKNGKNGIQQ